MKNKKVSNEKRKMIMGIAMMIFAIAVSAGTYAYYQTTITGTVSGTILAWNCNTSPTNHQFTMSTSNLKPGVSGTIPITVTSTNFAATYTVKITAVSQTLPNLKFYDTLSGTTYSNELTVGASGTTTSGTISAAANGSSVKTIYYNWPIGTAAETPLFTSANGSVTITFQLVCTQTNSTPYGA